MIHHHPVESIVTNHTIFSNCSHFMPETCIEVGFQEITTEQLVRRYQSVMSPKHNQNWWDITYNLIFPPINKFQTWSFSFWPMLPNIFHTCACHKNSAKQRVRCAIHYFIFRMRVNSNYFLHNLQMYLFYARFFLRKLNH